MNFLRHSKLLLLLLLCSFAAAAQQKTITGKILDADGKPVHGATVGIKGSTTSTATGEDGSFSIVVPSNESVLKFSYIGLQYQEMVIGSRTALSVNMKKDNKELDDVVVVGYGTQRARNVTGSIVSVDTKKLEDLPVASLTEMLRGQVPGVMYLVAVPAPV